MSEISLGGWISIISLALVFVVPFIVKRAISNQLGLKAAPAGNIFYQLFPGLKWLGLLLVSAFFGLMVATAVGAVYPPAIKPAAEWLCGEGHVEIQSQHYSYKPGQSGVSHNVLCTEADGESRVITMPSIVAAFVMYSIIIFALLLVLQLLRSNLRGRDTPRSSSKPKNLIEILSERSQTSSGGQPDAASRQPDFEGVREMVSKHLGPEMANLVQQAMKQGGMSTSIKKTIVVNGETVTPADSPSDVAERLRQLQELKQQGLITEEEYQEKRKTILASL